jgi:hypothetical protein
MNKFLSVGLFTALAYGPATARISFGPELGINISGYSGKNAGVKQQGITTVTGWRLGGVADIQLTNNISLQPAALFTKNGYKYVVADQIGDSYEYNFNANTVEIPLNVLYKIGREDRGRFFIGAGPYMGINVGGKIKAHMLFGGDMKTAIGSDSTDNIKRFDFGVGVNAGYQLPMGMFIRIHYQQGIANMQPMGNKDNTMMNYHYGISVGYTFGSSKPNDKDHTGTR